MEDIPILLAGGDSFTAHLTSPNEAWPTHVKDWIASTRIVAEMASDNELIARNVMKGIEKYEPTHVAVGWSDPNRFSLYVNQEHPLYNADTRQDENTRWIYKSNINRRVAL